MPFYVGAFVVDCGGVPFQCRLCQISINSAIEKIRENCCFCSASILLFPVITQDELGLDTYLLMKR